MNNLEKNININPLDKFLYIYNNIQNTSIFKIANFLSLILNQIDKINIIDVGCAIGDFLHIIEHKNIFIIGIDPLHKYYNIQQNLSKYSVLYDCAIDLDNNDKMFNITPGKDCSSLYDFNIDQITNDITNTTHFYMPNYRMFESCSVIEQKKVKCSTLKDIIIENNLETNIIHILKVDAQGNDLNVIKSLENYINNILFIVMESNSENTSTLYKNSSTFNEDYEYLTLNNFELIGKEILLRDDYDCLYYNKSLLIENFEFNALHYLEQYCRTE